MLGMDCRVTLTRELEHLEDRDESVSLEHEEDSALFDDESSDPESELDVA